MRRAAFAGIAAFAFAFHAVQPASALTVGEYRRAYQVLHALDPMTTPQRVDYIARHKAEIDVANERLAAAELVRKTVYHLNALLMQQGAPPVICNYDSDDDDVGENLETWVDEFRAGAIERAKLLAGPETDAKLDLVDMHDVITNKMLEEFPCPAVMPSAPHAQAAAHLHHP